MPASPSAQMCRTIAYEAVARGARVNVHELWALLEHVEQSRPNLIVDVGSGPALAWAWWMVSGRVVTVAPERSGEVWAAHGRMPEGVVVIDGSPADPVTVQRVADQVAGHGAGLLVLDATRPGLDPAAVYPAYAPLVASRGLVAVHGIAAPGVRAFWRSLGGGEELVGGVDPVGFGMFEIHGKDRANHGR